MATKKSGSSAKKSSAASRPAKATTTKVTTVKAVEAEDSRRSNRSTSGSFMGILQTPITGAAIAEFIGTFLFAILVLIVSNQSFYLFFGLVSVFMLIGGLSGSHINPAITVGAWVTRRIGWTRAVSYLVAQFLAAMLALVVMNAFIGQAPAVSSSAASMGQTAPTLFKATALASGKEWTVFFAELLGAAILGFAYASVLRPTVKKKLSSAFTVGGAGFIAVAFASTVVGYVGTTAIVNPAVAITVNALSFSHVWTLAVYVVASVIGAIVGFFLYDLIRTAEE